MNTHWIALYLAGQYPGKYIIPNRLDIYFILKGKSPTYFNDGIIAQLQSKSDLEYFKTLLDIYSKYIGKEELIELLKLLEVPESVQYDPFSGVSNELCSLTELNTYLPTLNEADFSRYVVLPILHEMGYQNIEYKGEVYESDFGTDFFVMKFLSPGGVEHYTGVQTKSKKMTTGSSVGSELYKLINETQAAFDVSHTLTNGLECYISEFIIFNSFSSPESAIKTYFGSKGVKGKNIRYYGKEGILSLVKELKLKKDFYK